MKFDKEGWTDIGLGSEIDPTVIRIRFQALKKNVCDSFSFLSLSLSLFFLDLFFLSITHYFSGAEPSYTLWARPRNPILSLSPFYILACPNVLRPGLQI